MPTTPPTPTKPTLSLRRCGGGIMGVAIADNTIVHVTLPCTSRRAALEHLPDGDLQDTPLAELFWTACELYFATGRDTFGELPIALPPATSFAGKVYRVLRSIPAGETMTYGEIAKRIHQPTAARAVAGAMGRNPTPLILPCHRVVGANQTLGGFSAPGGTTTKRRLLKLERAAESEKQ